MKKSQVDLVIVGSIGLDTIETPFARKTDILGGSVSYACAASSFFVKTGMVGIIGTDFPAKYERLYRNMGINTEGLHPVEGKTFRWSGIYEKDMIGRRTISTELNVFADFQPELPAAYVDAPFVLLGNISPELQLHVLDQTRKPKFVLADTMNLWIDIARKPLMKVIARVDMLSLNDEEARLLTGQHNLLKCAKAILKMGPRYVVIKKGEHGAMLFSKSNISIIPAFPVEVLRDPTGAGDAFAGGFIGKLAQGQRTDEKSVKRALLYGSVVASFNVEDFSLTRLEKLNMKQITDRLEALEKMIGV